MRIDRRTFENAVTIERREHHITYEWLQWYLKKYKRLPKEEEFYLHIANDHLKSNEEYYDKLKDSGLV